MTHRTIPLNQLGSLEEGTITQLKGGTGFVSRLATLGFTPGAPLKMVQNFGHGPLIVIIRDARIALGRGEANKILIHKGLDHD